MYSTVLGWQPKVASKRVIKAGAQAQSLKAGAQAQRLKAYTLSDCNCTRRTQKEQKAEIMELWLSYSAKSLSYSAKNKGNRPSGGSGPWLLLPE